MGFSFSVVDIVFAIIILFFALTAGAHGLIRELFGKISFVAGLIAALFFCGKLSSRFTSIENQHIRAALAFVALFVAVFLCVKIIQITLEKIFSGEILGSLDKALGFLLGAVEGFAVVCFIFVVLEAQSWFTLPESLTGKSFFWGILKPILAKPVEYLGELFV